jgi:hypothetical protein
LRGTSAPVNQEISNAAWEPREFNVCKPNNDFP